MDQKDLSKFRKAEFHAPSSTTLTGKHLLDFLNFVNSIHPEFLEKPIHYLYDGEFWPFSGIVLEANKICLLGND